jgi:hypothetical protein
MTKKMKWEMTARRTIDWSRKSFIFFFGEKRNRPVPAILKK